MQMALLVMRLQALKPSALSGLKQRDWQWMLMVSHAGVKVIAEVRRSQTETATATYHFFAYILTNVHHAKTIALPLAALRGRCSKLIHTLLHAQPNVCEQLTWFAGSVHSLMHCTHALHPGKHALHICSAPRLLNKTSTPFVPVPFCSSPLCASSLFSHRVGLACIAHDRPSCPSCAPIVFLARQSARERLWSCSHW